jgi:hypothetical protein
MGQQATEPMHALDLHTSAAKHTPPCSNGASFGFVVLVAVRMQSYDANHAGIAVFLGSQGR